MVAPADDDWLGRRIAKAISEALEVRAGDVLDAECIRDRSNNAACYVLEVLAAAEQEEQTPVGYETAEQHADRVIR